MFGGVKNTFEKNSPGQSAKSVYHLRGEEAGLKQQNITLNERKQNGKNV